MCGGNFFIDNEYNNYSQNYESSINNNFIKVLDVKVISDEINLPTNKKSVVIPKTKTNNYKNKYIKYKSKYINLKKSAFKSSRV